MGLWGSLEHPFWFGARRPRFKKPIGNWGIESPGSPISPPTPFHTAKPPFHHRPHFTPPRPTLPKKYQKTENGRNHKINKKIRPKIRQKTKRTLWKVRRTPKKKAYLPILQSPKSKESCLRDLELQEV